MNSPNLARYEIVFTGRVQGVGFRYTTVRIAEQFAVSGWVRNEPDGSVRCVVEGEGPELDRFVVGVRQAMQHSIEDVRTSRTAATGQFTGFTIQR